LFPGAKTITLACSIEGGAALELEIGPPPSARGFSRGAFSKGSRRRGSFLAESWRII